MPGFFTCHTHLSGPRSNVPTSVALSPSYSKSPCFLCSFHTLFILFILYLGTQCLNWPVCLLYCTLNSSRTRTMLVGFYKPVPSTVLAQNWDSVISCVDVWLEVTGKYQKGLTGTNEVSLFWRGGSRKPSWKRRHLSQDKRMTGINCKDRRSSGLRDEVCRAMELGDRGAFGFLKGMHSDGKGNKERGGWKRLAGMQWHLNWKRGGVPRAVESHMRILSTGRTWRKSLFPFMKSLQSMKTPEFLASTTPIPSNHCILFRRSLLRVGIRETCLSVGCLQSWEECGHMLRELTFICTAHTVSYVCLPYKNTASGSKLCT